MARGQYQVKRSLKHVKVLGKTRSTAAVLFFTLGVVILGLSLFFNGVTITTTNKAGETHTLTISKANAKLKLADTNTKAVIDTTPTTNDDTLVEEDVPTVEEIDAQEEIGTDPEECIQTGECGYGTAYQAINTFSNTDQIDISSYQAFKDSVNNQCVYQTTGLGAQCFALADLLWIKATGQHLNACGTGAARGTWEACRNTNTRNSTFELITNKEDVRAGDVVVESMNNQWGHIHFADGPIRNNYLAAYGQNQGGRSCLGMDGAAPNVINLNVSTFLGAFRYVGWKPVAPPTPAPNPQPEPPTPTPVDPHQGMTWFYTYQFQPYTGQRGYKHCVEYQSGGCWAR